MNFLQKKIFNFINYPVFHNFITHMLEENLQCYRKMSSLLFSTVVLFYLNAYHCICENYHRNLQFLNICYEFHLFYQKFAKEIFSLIRKCLHFISNYVIILFVRLALYLSFFQIIFNFIRYPM